MSKISSGAMAAFYRPWLKYLAKPDQQERIHFIHASAV
jgi:hypothetical protein